MSELKTMTKRKRWITRIAFAVLIVLTAGLLFYNFIVPSIAKTKATSILENFGLKDVELNVHAVSTSGLYATNLRERTEQFHIGAIGIDYSLSELMSGRLETVTLVGVEWEMLVRDGQIKIAPFDALPKSDPESTDALPFKTIHLKSSHVGIDWDGYKIRVPVNATITNEGINQFAVDMSMDVLGTPVTIRGSIKPRTDDDDVEHLVIDADLRYLKTPWKIAGDLNLKNNTVDIDVKYADTRKAGEEQLSIEVAFRRFRDGHSIDLDIRSQHKDWQWKLFGDDFKATNVNAALSVAIDQSLKITTLAAKFESPSVSWNQFALTKCIASLDQRDGKLFGLAQASGDGWTTHLNADAPAVRRLLASDQDRAINASWKLKGKLPRWIANASKRFGFSIEQHEDADFSGQLTTHVYANRDVTPADADAVPWRIVSNDITVDVGKLDVQTLVDESGMPEDSQSIADTLMLKSVNGKLKVSADITPHSMQWQLLPRSTLSFDEATYGRSIANGKFEGLTIGGNRFTFKAEAEDAASDIANQLNQNASTGKWRGHLFASLGQPVIATFQSEAKPNLKLTPRPMEVSLKNLNIRAAIGSDARPSPHLPSQNRTPLGIEITFDDSSFRSPNQHIDLKNISATLPISLNGADVEPGQFSIGEIRYKDRMIPPLQGRARLVDNKVEISADWKAFQNANVTANATLNLSPNDPNGDIVFSIPEFQWTESDQALLQQLAPAIGDLTMEGNLAVEGKIRFARRILSPNIQVSTKGLTLKSKEFDITAKGIGGTITIDGFSPLTTPGKQELQVNELHIGKAELNDGKVELRVESAESILIERTNWRWGDKGKFYVNSIRVGTQWDKYDLTVIVEDLVLNDWIDLLTDKRVNGQGLLDGVLVVTVRPGTEKVFDLQRSFLRTKGSPIAERPAGKLQFKDADFARQLLVQTDSRWETDNNWKQVLDQIVAALNDMEFHRLDFDFVPGATPDEMQLRVTTAGRGLDPFRSSVLPLGSLTINVNNFGKLLKDSLLWKRGGENAVRNALEDFFK